jgi:Putative MetA-pathway of phenol degradation
MNSTAFFIRVHLFLLSGLGQLTYAAHPLVTDDTSTQGRQHHQIEVNSDWARFAGETGHAAAFTYSYGATDALDLYGNVPVSLSTPSGKGDLSFGAKWRFWESTRSALAVKPELFLPTGNGLRGLGNGSPSLGVTLLATHTSGRWGFDGNIGFSANRYRVPSFENTRHLFVWRTSVAIAYRPNEQWAVVADTGIARNIEKAANTNPAFLLVGAIYSPRENVDIDIGFKSGLNSAEVDRQVGAGLTVRF